ncbi:MAG: hypothetical protein JST58_11475 [Bacteroidetes bacterium]|nr:hypothetical protein [Bacteroidota bacterium]
MKKSVTLAFSILLLLFYNHICAQVGIGTSTPNASAQLDVTATNKGFLPPRVSLTSSTDLSTISSPATGLLVYNTASSGTSPNMVSPGYYFFNGASWSPINSTYSPGQVIQTLILPYSSIGQSANTSISTTVPNYSTLATYNYTPASSSSTIIVEYNTVYVGSGYGTDDWYSRITVNGSQVSYGYQQWTGAAYGGGTRSGTLFPVMGAYTNSSTSPITILIQAARGSSDDSFTFKGDVSTWLKITEIAR